MGRTLLWLCVLVALCFGGFYAYRNYIHPARVGEDGALTCEGCMTPEQARRFDIEDHGGAADGQSEHKTNLSRSIEDYRNLPGDPATFPSNSPTSATNPGQTGPAPIPPPTYAPSAPPFQPQPGFTNTAAYAGQTYQPRTSPPVSDSLRPTPPNGLAFAGRGAYQWYREGDLTWRVNTETGATCVDFATLGEWRKPLVRSHGCGASR